MKTVFFYSKLRLNLGKIFTPSEDIANFIFVVNEDCDIDIENVRSERYR